MCIGILYTIHSIQERTNTDILRCGMYSVPQVVFHKTLRSLIIKVHVLKDGVVPLFRPIAYNKSYLGNAVPSIPCARHEFVE